MRCPTLLKSILTVCLINTSFLSRSIPIKAQPIPPVITAQVSNQLSEKQISQILKDIEKAYQDKNITGISKYIASFASATVLYKASQISSSFDFIGKDEIVNYLDLILQKIQERKVIEQRVSIQIMEDGQLAIVKVRTVKEVTTTDGKKYYSSGLDVVHFALIDHQPMIVFVKTEGWIAEHPAKK